MGFYTDTCYYCEAAILSKHAIQAPWIKTQSFEPQIVILCEKCLHRQRCSTCCIRVDDVIDIVKGVKHPLSSFLQSEWIIQICSLFDYRKLLSKTNTTITRDILHEFFIVKGVNPLDNEVIQVLSESCEYKRDNGVEYHLECKNCFHRRVVSQIDKWKWTRKLIMGGNSFQHSINNPIILCHIFSYLPVPQFIPTINLVCKFWYNCLSSEYFVVRHWTLSTQFQYETLFNPNNAKTAVKLFSSGVEHTISIYPNYKYMSIIRRSNEKKILGNIKYLLQRGIRIQLEKIVSLDNRSSANGDLVAIIFSELCSETHQFDIDTSFLHEISFFGLNCFLRRIDINLVRSVKIIQESYGSTISQIIEKRTQHNKWLNDISGDLTLCRSLFDLDWNKTHMSLRKLKLRSGYFTQDDIELMPNFPNVCSLDILHSDFDNLKTARELLTKFPNVTKLRYPFFMGLIELVAYAYNEQLTAFETIATYNLTRSSQIYIPSIEYAHADTIVNFFRMCPNLESLALYVGPIHTMTLNNIVQELVDNESTMYYLRRFSLFSEILQQSRSNTELTPWHIKMFAGLMPNLTTLEFSCFNIGGVTIDIFQQQKAPPTFENSVLAAIGNYMPDLQYLSLSLCVNSILNIQSFLGSLRNLKILQITRNVSGFETNMPVMEYLHEEYNQEESSLQFPDEPAMTQIPDDDSRQYGEQDEVCFEEPDLSSIVDNLEQSNDFQNSFTEQEEAMLHYTFHTETPATGSFVIEEHEVFDEQQEPTIEDDDLQVFILEVIPP
jgi:hypothetical protein